MPNLENLIPGNHTHVRYKSIVQLAKVVSNDVESKVIVLSVIVGGCCGSMKYENISYPYNSFHLCGG